MAREKEGYRETLSLLAETYPMTVNKGQAKDILGTSYDTLAKLIRKGKIKECCGKIPLGSLASFICG